MIRWAVAASLLCLAILIFVLMHPLPPPSVSGYVQVSNDGRAKGYEFGATVTDGSRLYFTEELGSELVLAQVSTAGGETGLLPVPFPAPEILDFSLSRSELLVASLATGGAFTWPLWVVPVPAGTPRRFGNVLATGAAWSPEPRRKKILRGWSAITRRVSPVRFEIARTGAVCFGNLRGQSGCF
jgi:hypothetical protein